MAMAPDCRRRPFSKAYTSYALTALTRGAELATFTNTSVWAHPRVLAATLMFSPYSAWQTLPWPYGHDLQKDDIYPWMQWGGVVVY
jgi:hypothetical protein